MLSRGQISRSVSEAHDDTLQHFSQLPTTPPHLTSSSPTQTQNNTSIYQKSSTTSEDNSGPSRSANSDQSSLPPGIRKSGEGDDPPKAQVPDNSDVDMASSGNDVNEGLPHNHTLNKSIGGKTEEKRSGLVERAAQELPPARSLTRRPDKSVLRWYPNPGAKMSKVSEFVFVLSITCRPRNKGKSMKFFRAQYTLSAGCYKCERCCLSLTITFKNKVDFLSLVINK